MSGGGQPAALRALGYLVWRTTVNRVRRVRRQLRSPRYAVAVLVGIGYLALVFSGQRHQSAALAPPGAAVELAGSLFLLILLGKWWLLGADRQALAFSPAELQFLFPAPVSRRTLLGYKLARAQLPILINVMLWTFLLGRGHAGLPAPAYALGLWLLFTTLFLHRLGVALVRDALTGHRLAGLRRALPVLAGVGCGVAVACVGVVRAWPAMSGELAAGPDGLPEALRILAESAPLSWMLLPFRLLVQPLNADSLSQWLIRFPIALGLLGGHLVWVFRADRAFEESAIAASAARAKALAGRERSGHGTDRLPRPGYAWIRLAPEGHPVTAIIWKNTLRLLRTAGGAVPLIIVVGIGVLGTAGLVLSGRTAALSAIAALCLAWALALVALGPLFVRNDLRSELDRLTMLKGWPLPGGILMTGYVASSALVLTLLQLLLGSMGLAAVLALGQFVPAWPVLVAGVVPAVLLLALINTVSIGLQHAGALLFPAWVRLEIRPGGIEALGQQFLTMGAALILLSLTLIGPAALAGAVWWLLAPSLGGWASSPALAVAVIALGLECFLMLDWLGDLYDGLDPSAPV